jgi:endogenous inhibitor of DNA gyrase (YacG/DUF329 family)
MPDPVLREGRCPRCGKVFHFRSVAQHKPYPFCSARCRDIDLGNWLTEKYVIPGPPAPGDESENEEADKPSQDDEPDGT